jgi:hypothetical protein
MPGMLTGGWGPMVRMIADRLGIELDEIRETFEREYSTEAFDTPVMHVPKDGVQAGALRMVNAIPEVCRRGPGLVSTLDLPYTPSTNVIK